jgi:3-hydroxyacyl-CoA dehydrogenase / 3-hydroxy-2-methylbutyryl-CoA dehydrogenase
MEIAKKTAVVTGGASGLGEGTVRMFRSEGGNVAIMDVNEERGKLLEKELSPGAFFVKTDVTDNDDVNRALSSIEERFGGIHFLVSCAGTGIAQRTVSKEGPHPLKSFEWLVKLNLVGTFNVASKAASLMSKNEPNEEGERGVIVNVASVAAFDGQIGQAAYAASKAGVVGMTLPMARDLSGLGIRVMAIAPGIFWTPLTNSLPEESMKRLAETIPFPRRTGKIDEFASLVRAIVGNPYLNGETIRLDGAVRMAPK